MRSPAGSRVPNRPVPSFSSAGTDSFVRKLGGSGRGEENAAAAADMGNLGGLKVDGEDVLSGSPDPKASSVANFSQSRRPFAGAWKPVIDGKVQLGDSPSNATATSWNASWQSSSLQSTPSSASPKQFPQHGSEKPSVSNVSGSSDIKKDDEGNDSDSESRRVPELPEKKDKVRSQKAGGGGSSRKRSGASSTDKEGKRLKRLLRNRVSAQQARERKKAYLIELERKAKELEVRNAELEEKNATLQRENYMLRQIVKNTTMRGGDAGSS